MSKGPVVAQLQLVFVASLRWLGGEIPANSIAELFPLLDEGPSPVPAVVLHNAPGRFRPITDAITALIDGAQDTLDVVNPYVTDRRMIGRIVAAAVAAPVFASSCPPTPTTGPVVRPSSSTTGG